MMFFCVFFGISNSSLRVGFPSHHVHIYKCILYMYKDIYVHAYIDKYLCIYIYIFIDIIYIIYIYISLGPQPSTMVVCLSVSKRQPFKSL